MRKTWHDLHHPLTAVLTNEEHAAFKEIARRKGYLPSNYLAVLVRTVLKNAKPTKVHASDCALHNAPALPVGPCDCGIDDAPFPTQHEQVKAAE